MKKNELVRYLKSCLIVRFAVWPYMVLKKKRDYVLYHKSQEDKKIRNLKNCYKGKRCFIIGNGSSLLVNDLEKLKKEFTFGSNRIYNIFKSTNWRPSFYLAEDEDAYSELIPTVLNTDIEKFIFSLSAKNYEVNSNKDIYHALWTNNKYIINRYNDKSIHFSEDISDHISDGYTVTYSAIQLAVYMGFKEIYLLGVDFNYSRITNKYGLIKNINSTKTYFDGVERKGSYLNYHSTVRAYETARKYCEENGILLQNATRGGKLDILTRVDFDSLFK